MPRVFPAFALATALFSPPALASATCDVLEPRDDSDLHVVDVSAADGDCSVSVGGQTIVSSVDPDIDSCTVTKGGVNIIVIWPANAEGGYCTDSDGGGINILVIWPT